MKKEEIEKKKAKRRKYYQEHKEQERLYNEKYQQEHKEEINAYRKKYRQEHKEKIKAYNEKYRQEHKEEIKAKKKKYYQEHKEQWRVYSKKYRQNCKKENKENRKNIEFYPPFNIEDKAMKKYVKEFCEYLISKNRSKHTTKAFECSLKQYAAFLEEKGTDYINANYNIIEEYMLFLSKKGYETSSRNCKLAAIKSFYNFLSKQEVIVKNPASFVETAKEEKKFPAYLTKAEAAAMLEEAKKYKWQYPQRNYLLIALLLNCGFRVSEISNIKIKDINFADGYIKVRGKGSKDRIVGFSEDVGKLMKSYIEGERQQMKGDKDYLFISECGKKMCRSISTIVKQVAIAALPPEKAAKIHPHSLRHTCATMLYTSGIDIFVIQDVLGHENVSTTRLYTHIAPNQAVKATQGLILNCV